jgi:hypothetical protein
MAYCGSVGLNPAGKLLKGFTVRFGNRLDHVSKLRGAVAELVGIEVGVVSGVINLESSGVEASDWRLRHEATYHEA